jgi:hypothetical protein
MNSPAAPLRGLLAGAVLLGTMLRLSAPARAESAPASPAATLRIDWTKLLRKSATTASLQVVVNPPLRRDSPIHDAAFSALRALKASNVRYVPWLPYPRLAVPELEPPTAGRTSWDFSLIDPMTLDFLAASADRPVMLNFSTIPDWLFVSKTPLRLPADPNQVFWSYTRGAELREPSGRELGDYYARLVSWYVKGGFVDENGRRHDSGHHFKIAWWEVLNEPDLERRPTPAQYTAWYDAIVGAIHTVDPEIKFVALALAHPELHPEMFEYFLNPANHRPGTPLDMISYHFYAQSSAGDTIEQWQHTFFAQADGLLNAVRFIDAIRQRLSPSTQTALDEIGAILPGDPAGGAPIPPAYWNLVGALHAYIYAESARLGIELVSASQLVGYPSQFPSVTMLDWQTGAPNARYRALQLLLANFAVGDTLVDSRVTGGLGRPTVLAQAMVTPAGRKILLINQRNHPLLLALAEPVPHGTLASVDVTTGSEPARVMEFSGGSLELAPFAVAVLTISP